MEELHVESNICLLRGCLPKARHEHCPVCRLQTVEAEQFCMNSFHGLGDESFGGACVQHAYACN